MRGERREGGDRGGQRDGTSGGRRRTRIRPLRGRQQAPAWRKRSKMFWKQRSLSLPHPPLCPPRVTRPARPPLFRFRWVQLPLYIHEARPPYIFRISNKCTVRGDRRKGGLQDGVPPPSLITFSHPSGEQP